MDHPHFWGKLFRDVDWDMYFEHEKKEPVGTINPAIPKIDTVGEPSSAGELDSVCSAQTQEMLDSS